MSATLIALFLITIASVVSYLAGKSAGVAECENEHTIALRLAALARDEERRQDRAEVLSEALGLMGQKWAHPSNPSFVIDLREDGEA